ncbi:MAG: R3H domain-containing nucleic acid-binding protein [bacterium]|nr:R3H domain-containing nucleic acid-binding protein [bacterium]
MGQDTLRVIEQTAKDLLHKIGLEGDIRISQKEDGSFAIDVTCQDPQLYIGEKGQTTAEILYILKSMVRRKLGEPVYVALDINDYQKNKERYVRELARTTADEVSLLKTPKELPAMSPAERRIVHMELQERSDIETESAGEGEERRVIIRYGKQKKES